MTEAATALKTGLGLLLWPLNLLPATAALVSCAVLVGAGMLLVIKYTTPQARLRVARDRMSSAIYELRLYLDNPRRILAAQRRLCLWSAAYLIYLLPSLALLLGPLGLLYAPLEARYGLDPVPLGQPVLLRVDLSPTVSDEDRRAAAQATIAGSLAVSLTAAPVLVSGSTLYMRLRVGALGTHDITVKTPTFSLDKQVSASRSATVMSVERRAGLAGMLAIGGEAPLPDAGKVTAVTVIHPTATQRWLGLPIPWWLFGLMVATATAFGLRRRFGVVL